MASTAHHLLADQAQLLLVLFARLGAFFMVAPFFSDDGVPGRIRLIMAIALTIALSGLIRPLLGALPDKAGGYLVLILTEILCGLALGLLIRLFFLGLNVAGALMSVQIGLTSALAFDPATGGQSPVLARLVSLSGLLVCLAANVHHVWIAALIDSYRVFPVGGLPPAGDTLHAAVHTVSQGFSIALSLAAPLCVYAIVVHAMLGLIARLTPAIQVFFIAQPLVLALGLLLAALMVPSVLAAFAGLHDQWFAGQWGAAGE